MIKQYCFKGNVVSVEYDHHRIAKFSEAAVDVLFDALNNVRNETIEEIQKKLTDEYHGMLSDESMKIYQVINYLEEMKGREE